MKKTILFVLALALVSCSQTAPTISTTKIAASTETLVEASVAQFTDTPTLTIVPPTSTLDLIHVPTHTPQPAATCPPVNAKLRAQFAAAFKNKKAPYHDARTAVLNFLNEGGDPQAAIAKLAEANITANMLDLTHDGVQEFILPSGYFTVLGCQSGKYVNLLEIAPAKDSQMTAVPLAVQDLNQNGLLEIFIGQMQSQDSATYQIFEWNGTAFLNLLSTESQKKTPSLYIENQVIKALGRSNAQKGALEGNWEIADMDGNGLKDIIVRAGVTSSSSLENSLILEWDGKSYVVVQVLKEATPTPPATPTPLPFSETCSVKDPELHFQEPPSGKARKAILDYLNAGGIPEKLSGIKYYVTVRDLNNDTAPEVILKEDGMSFFMIFTCRSGKYIEEPQFYDVFDHSRIITITDNNKNGFPEVFAEGISCVYWSCGSLYVVEWDGEHFVQRIKGFDGDRPLDYAPMAYPQDGYLKDLDGDGIAELIWRGELFPDWHSDRWFFYPGRLGTHVFKWNGAAYTEQIVEYSAPQYHFQAVQDGDRYAKAGLYEKALQLYQQAIEDDSLEWWTEDLHNSILGSHKIGPCAENPSPCPTPTEDPGERPVLGAYAYFKSMVVYLLMGDARKAETTYQNLLAAYPAGTPGYEVTEMANSFWREYEFTQDVGKACARSIAYIKTQPRTLLYLTGSTRSNQGIRYDNDPSEVCSFK